MKFYLFLKSIRITKYWATPRKWIQIIFEDKACLISDPSGQEIFRIKMQGKSFSLNPLNEEHNFSKPAHCSGNVAQNVGALSSQSFIVYAKEQNGKWFTQHGGEHFKL